MKDYIINWKDEKTNKIVTKKTQELIDILNTYEEDGDYHCDKCGILGNFLDGTMWGVGKGNMETCLCNECLENYKN